MEKNPAHDARADAREVSLVASCTAGDRHSCEALARWLLPQVRRTVALMYGGGPDADDIVQVVMIRVMSGLPAYRGESTLYVWMHRIAINAVQDHWRRRKIIYVSDEVLDALPNAEQTDPDDETQRYALMERLSAHFAALKPKLRLPLVLSLLHGYSVPEIAAMLDIGFEAAKKRLLRGRQLLLQRLSKDPVCWGALKELGR